MLSSNKIKTLPESITRLRKLELLLLSNNKLNRLPQNLSGWSSLKTLVLTGNPLVPGELERIKSALPGCEVVFY
jgi:Leucine-rich repeat (LRR) protein